MLTVEFQTGALVLLVVAALTIAWIQMAERADRQRAGQEALEGVGHEFRITLQRFMAELSAVLNGARMTERDFLPVAHPQLDAVHARTIHANRNAMSVIGACYMVLDVRKQDLRAAWREGEALEPVADAAIDDLIDGIVTLYLWEAHRGARPSEARSTRTWDVRRWMKRHDFHADAFPERHLRDDVVERLRTYGMDLKPRPLTHTAHEYFSLRYDRYADPHAPFGRRNRRHPSRPKGSASTTEEQPMQALHAPNGTPGAPAAVS